MWFIDDRRGAIYIFSVVLIAAMLVVLVGALVALEKTVSGSIANREEELSYFQLESVRAMENKISSVMKLDPGGDSLKEELDRTISVLREQAEERGMWQNISYIIDFQPSSLDLSPRRVCFEVTTRSQGRIAYDDDQVYLNDIFVNSGYLFIKNRKLELRFRVRGDSDEERGYVNGGAVYAGSDVTMASSMLTDYLNMSSWTNASSVYSYTVEQQPGLITLRLRNETEKVALTKYLYVKPDEVQFQINVEPQVSTENSVSYGVGLTPNINGPGDDQFRIDNTTGGQLNPSSEWDNATQVNASFQVQRSNSWVVVYDNDPQPYAFSMILDEADSMEFSSTGGDEMVMMAPGRRGRFIVNGIIRTYRTYSDAVTDMRNLKKLGKPPSGRSNYLEPLVLALTIDDLYFDPPAPNANQRVSMIAAVDNYGTKDAYDVVVHFYDGEPLADRSNLLGATNISTLLNGNTELCSTTWTFSEPGVHEIYAVLDPDNLLAEDHSDNVEHSPLKIYPQDVANHDVSVEALQIDERNPSDGDVVSVRGLIHNCGNREEHDVVVRLKVIDDANVSRNISSNILPNLPIDYYVSTSISFTYQDGDQRVNVTVDPVANETNLSNNHKDALIGSSSILLVADDNLGPKDGTLGSTSTIEFLSALDDPAKYDVFLWSEEERGDPGVDVLLFFDAVAWTCGDYDGHDVETNDARTLVEFVDRGGHLVLEGEDIAYRHHQNATGDPDFFLWNVTRSHIAGYYNASLAKTVPFDDINLDGRTENTVPQLNVYTTHPVMNHVPRVIPSNYTAAYPDVLVTMGSERLAVYEAEGGSDVNLTGTYSPDGSGFIRDWLIIGGYSGYDIDHDYLGGESTVRPYDGRVDNGETWQVHHDSNRHIDFNSLLSPNDYATAYAFAYVYSPEDRDAKMKVGSDDGVKIYLNGNMVHRNPVWRGASPDQDTVNVHLDHGWNTVLAKVVEKTGQWGLYLRFTDLSDQPIEDLGIELRDPSGAFMVLEDSVRSSEFSWNYAPSVVSSPVLHGSDAFQSNGYNNFSYVFPYTVGEGVDQYKYIDLWFYFEDSDSDILFAVKQDGSWDHRWGWDVESTYDGYPDSRQGTTLNCPSGEWKHYRLDLVSDLGLTPSGTVDGMGFLSDSSDVYFDHIHLARKDSGKASMVAWENATTGTKVAYFAFPVRVIENRTRRLLIKNAIDWVGGRTLNRPPVITITAPSGAEVWSGDQNITWSASDPDGDTLDVDLYYSSNGGTTWIELAHGLTGVSYWTWDTTTVPDDTYLVKAVVDDSTLTDEDTSASFDIDNINDPPTVTVTRPNVVMRLSGNEQVTWTASDPEGQPLTYDIQWWDGTTWHTIVSDYTPSNPSSPDYYWDTTTIPDGVDYLLKVKAMDEDNTVEDVSDEPFSVDNDNQDPSVILLDPNGGEEWAGTHTITWDMDDPDGADDGDPLGHPYRDTLTATIDLNSSDAEFRGGYSPDSQGFIRDWLLVGGYSGCNIDHDYLGGESTILPWAGKLDNGKRWWKHHDSNTRIDFNSLLSPNQYATGYAFAYLYNEEDRDVKMKVGSDDEVKIYLNGNMVHCYPHPRGTSGVQDTVDVHLNQGWNTVLAKVCEHSGGWALYFQFVNMTGHPVTDLNIALAKPNSYDTGKPYATGARLGAVVDLTNMNWDTTTFPNGNYTANLTVSDGRGGVAWDDSDSQFEVINNRDPVVEVIYPNGEEILFGNVSVVWNATDPDGDEMTFDLYYKQGTGSWNHIINIDNSSWRWYLWDISGLPDSPPEYYIKVEARDPYSGLGWDVSDDGWYINNADGEYGDGGGGNYTGYGDGEGNIGGSGTPPGWGDGDGDGTGDGSGDEDPADRESLIMLTQPLGGEEWSGTRTVSWVHDNFGTGLEFDVLASKDSGATWTTLASGITSTSYTWDTTDDGDSNDYRIMVQGTDDDGNQDTDSSSDFRVYNNDLPSVTVTSPNGGEWVTGTHTITWSASDPDGDGDNDPSTPYDLLFDVYYSDNSGATWNQIGSDVSSTNLDWDTTAVADGDDYRVRVVAKDGNIKGHTDVDISNSDFHVDNSNEAPDVSVGYPNGGEMLKENIPIQWTSTDPDGDTLTHSIYYSDDAGSTWNLIVGGFTDSGTDHTYDWDSTTVPDGTQYMIKVESDDGSLQNADMSDDMFIIDNTDPTVSMDSPNNDDLVSGEIQVQGTVSDAGGSGLDRVEIWARGAFEGYATVSGNDWDFSLDTTTLPEDATVTVEARAYDGSGNLATDSIEIKIDNEGN